MRHASDHEFKNQYHPATPAQNLANRKRFQSALRQRLPLSGFAGKTTAFRRIQSPVLQLISSQAWKYGGGMCVNLGIHFDFLPRRAGFPALLEGFEEFHCVIRKRLVPPGYTGDFWWRYGDDLDETQRSAEHLVETLCGQGLPFLEQLGQLPGPYRDLKEGNSAEFFCQQQVLFPGAKACWDLVQAIQAHLQ